MKTRTVVPLGLAIGSLFIAEPWLYGQSTAFTYQGQLLSGGAAANGYYDLKLFLYDAETNGNVVAGPITNYAILVSNGLFTTAMDFGPGVFTGADTWLHVGVRTNGGGIFTALSPRQQLTPTPNAFFATTASNLSGTLGSGQLIGTYGGAVSFTNPANSFSGSGAGLTGLNASQLTSGKVPLGALGNAWKISGNTGATPGSGNLMGTLDPNALHLVVNGERGLRLEPDLTNGAPNVIGGSANNYMDPGGVIGGFIGGGGATNYNGLAYSNRVSAYFGSIVGGYGNWIQGYGNNAIIGGGLTNTVESGAGASVIGGGQGNTIGVNAFAAVVAGGANNTNGGYLSAVGGGSGNFVSGLSDHSVIAGGQNNTIIGSQPYAVVSAIVGGLANTIGTNGLYDLVGGGYGNSIGAGSTYSSVAGGNQNMIGTNVGGAFIGGGTGNTNAFGGGFVGAGYYNRDQSYDAVIAGGAFNQNAGYRSFIGAGESNNIAWGAFSAIPSGLLNVAGSTCSFAAGQQAEALHDGTFVWSDIEGTPFTSTAPNQFLVRASGGVGINSANPQGSLHIYSTNNPTVVRIQSTGTPGFGRLEFVSNPQGDVNEWRPGFIQSLDAGGFTGGLGFYVNGTGSANKFSTNEVMRVMNGAVAIGTTAAQQMLSVNGGLNLDQGNGNSGGFNNGLASGTCLSFGSGSGEGIASQRSAGTQQYDLAFFTGFQNRMTILGNGNVGIGNNAPGFLLQVGNAYCDGNTWAPSSDRNVKSGFEAVDPEAILEEVAGLPITRWHYNNDPGTAHLGPVAQDFHEKFGLGADDKHITTVDADGVALAALQGLNQKLEKKLGEKEQEISDLKTRLEKLEAMVMPKTR